jgi:glycosyltransferase involved in cell wall biosynthesis
MRISLIIPALNEAACLAGLLNEIPRESVDQLIVVDNGSTDDTAGVARAGGAQVVTESQHGYGLACAAGVAVSRGEILVFMDGDGSFLPAELSRLVTPLVQGEADLALGSRWSGQAQPAMPPHQRFGNRLFVWLIRRQFGLPITDLGPFRAIHRNQLLALDMRERTYGWPLEMIIKSARLRYRILEIPVTYRPRVAGQSKVGGTWRGSILTAYRFFSVWIRYAMGTKL